MTIKQAKARIVELEALVGKVTALEKQLADANNSQKYWYTEATKRSEEMEQVHQLLDALPNAVAREVDGQYQRVSRSPVARLAAWLGHAYLARR